MTKKSKVRIRMKFCPYCGSDDVMSIYDVFEKEDAEWANFYASTATHGSRSLKYCGSCRKYFVVVGFGQERLRNAVEYWRKRDEERTILPIEDSFMGLYICRVRSCSGRKRSYSDGDREISPQSME